MPTKTPSFVLVLGLSLAVVTGGLIAAFLPPPVYAQDSEDTLQQDVKSLEERIQQYGQNLPVPQGPTREELQARITELEAELATSKAALTACQKAATEE